MDQLSPTLRRYVPDQWLLTGPPTQNLGIPVLDRLFFQYTPPLQVTQIQGS